MGSGLGRFGRLFSPMILAILTPSTVRSECLLYRGKLPVGSNDRFSVGVWFSGMELTAPEVAAKVRPCSPQDP